MKRTYRLLGILLAVGLVTTISLSGSTMGQSHGLVSDAEEASLTEVEVPATIETYSTVIEPPCQATAFCKACVATCVSECTANAGGNAAAMCEVTDDKCRCVCECTKTMAAEIAI